MKNNEHKKIKTFKIQKLPLGADVRIRVRLFSLFLKKLFPNTLRLPMLLSSSIALALIVLIILPPQISNYRIASFVNRAEAAQLALEEQKSKEIFHQKYVVREGVDKAKYVSLQTGIPLASTSEVQLREDVIEEWRHGKTNFSHIETDISGEPIKVVLNLENDNHMHIFNYAPKTCDEMLHDGISSESCENTNAITEDYIAHRKTFDGVHDIESLYVDDIEYLTSGTPPPSIRTLTFKNEITENENEYMVFISTRDNIEETFYFDAESYLLKKRTISIVENNTRFEMSEIVELAHTFIPADDWQEVFDTEKYNFTQIAVLPL